MALRHLDFGEDACEGAVARALWPARMQRLRRGPLVAAAPGAELWLDGWHNPAGGGDAEADAETADPSRKRHAVSSFAHLGCLLRRVLRDEP